MTKNLMPDSFETCEKLPPRKSVVNDMTMDLIEKVKAAGIVGAGGAGFPTHIKLSAKASCFIINAAECEPLIETDKYLCRTFPGELVEAIGAVAAHLGAKRAVIALKGKYKGEIAALKAAVTKAGADIEMFEMPAFYPAGDEQTMVHMVTGKSVPERGLPLDVGVVVDNVGTMLNLYHALHGEAVTDKYLSIVGGVKEPLMLKVPIGTAVTECIAAAQVQVQDYGVILGGPMMGKILADSQSIASAVVTKTTGNIIILPKDHYLFYRGLLPMEVMKKQAKAACIQCKMCTDLCPRFLIGHDVRPNLVMRNLWREHEITDTGEYIRAFGTAANCCDCGVCEMFACPMGLSPRKVNSYLKGQLKEKGIQVPKNTAPQAHGDIDMHRIPTGRLVARLGLFAFDGLHAKELVELQPGTVYIPFNQHIGKPAAPVVCAGQRVEKGGLLAKAAEGVSANIHASINGVLTSVDPSGARISKEEE